MDLLGFLASQGLHPMSALDIPMFQCLHSMCYVRTLTPQGLNPKGAAGAVWQAEGGALLRTHADRGGQGSGARGPAAFGGPELRQCHPPGDRAHLPGW